MEEHPVEVLALKRRERHFRVAAGLLFHGEELRQVCLAAAAHRFFTCPGLADGALIHSHSM